MNTRVFSAVSLLSFLLILLAAVGCRQGVEISELQTKSETVELGDAGQSSSTLRWVLAGC